MSTQPFLFPQIWGNYLQKHNLKVALVVSQFHAEITLAMQHGAQQVAQQAGIANHAIHVIPVPGAMELPSVVAWLAQKRQFDLIVAIGAIVQGETEHHLYLGHCVMQSLSQLAMSSQACITTALLTTKNLQQAQARSTSTTNKGAEAMLAAIQLYQIKTEVIPHV